MRAVVVAVVEVVTMEVEVVAAKELEGPLAMTIQATLVERAAVTVVAR
jgi:hypothetical protein